MVAPALSSILVFGATGTHGGAVARALLEANRPVRVLVRDASSSRARSLKAAGATLVVGDMLDRASLIGALSEVDVVYAVTTSFGTGAEEEVRQGETIIAAAQSASLPWLVLASVASAERAPVPHFQSKARIEAALRASGVPWTIIAPSYFYENVLGSQDALAAGELPLALPATTPLHQVALANLGALVEAVLARRDEHLSSRIEVAGDAPTPADMAAAFGARHLEVPLDQVRERSEDLGLMYEFLADPGYGIDVAAVRARYPEVLWLDYAQWARTIDLERP
jgi:uncharacterized protein YbjT (DUF2867 family)